MKLSASVSREDTGPSCIRPCTLLGRVEHTIQTIVYLCASFHCAPCFSLAAVTCSFIAAYLLRTSKPETSRHSPEDAAAGRARPPPPPLLNAIILQQQYVQRKQRVEGTLLVCFSSALLSCERASEIDIDIDTRKRNSERRRGLRRLPPSLPPSLPLPRSPALSSNGGCGE